MTDTAAAPDVAATLAAALDAIDAQAAEATKECAAAEVEWREGKAEIAKLLRNRCNSLAGYGTDPLQKDPLQSAHDRCEDAAETRKEQAQLLSLMRLARHHLVEARKQWALVETRMEVPA